MSKSWSRWDEAQDALLREVWASDKTIKVSLSIFPGRSYASLVQRAKALGLGGRPAEVRKCLTPTDGAIRAVLEIRPMEAVEIGAKVGVSTRTAMDRINRMRAAGEVYIHSWERFANSGYAARVWALGKKSDAKRPEPMTGSEKWHKRIRTLRKERPDELARVIAKRKHAYRKSAGYQVRRDPLVAAFFGGGAA